MPFSALKIKLRKLAETSYHCGIMPQYETQSLSGDPNEKRTMGILKLNKDNLSTLICILTLRSGNRCGLVGSVLAY